MTTGWRPDGRAGDRGHIEVAVHGQRQGARDRRGRHVEDVRGAAAALGAPHEGVALLHAEAVLLVDDQQRQAGELDVLLQEGVRADHEAGRAAGDPLERGPPLLGAERRGQQLGAAENAGEARRRLGVLDGERLGRSHERPLQAGLRRRARGSRAPRPSCPSPRRPAADGASGPCGPDRRPVRRALRAGARSVRTASPSRKARLRSDGGARAGAAARRCCSPLWSSSPTCMSRSSSSTRRARATLASSRSRGRCTATVASARVGSPSRSRSAAGRGSGSPRIAGRTARRRPRSSRADTCSLAGYTGTIPSVCTESPCLFLEDLVTLDDERRAAALRPIRAPHAQPHALRQHLDEVALVEPDRLDGAGVVAEHDAHDVHAATRRALGDDTPDGAAHGGLLADLEVADALAVAEILVAPRKVIDEVAHGLEAERRQAPGHRLGDVLQLGQRRRERGGVMEESRGWAAVRRTGRRRSGAGERARSLRDHSKGGGPRADVRADHRPAVALQHEMRFGPQTLDHLADELRLFVVDGVDGDEIQLVVGVCCSPRRSAAWRPWPS